MESPLVDPPIDTPAMRVAIERAASKWTIDIVLALQQGPRRFSEIRSASGASSQGLTRALRGMQRDGLVTRTVIGSGPQHVEYELTTVGRSLCSVVGEVRAWSARHGQHIVAARAQFDSTNAQP